MKTTNIAALLIKNVKTLTVNFPKSDSLNHRQYKFKYKFDSNNPISVADQIVVPDHQGDFLIGVVTELHTVCQIDHTSDENILWVVQKIDSSQYVELQEREKQFADEILERSQSNVISQAAKMLQEEIGGDPQQLLESIARLNGEEAIEHSERTITARSIAGMDPDQLERFDEWCEKEDAENSETEDSDNESSEHDDGDAANETIAGYERECAGNIDG